MAIDAKQLKDNSVTTAKMNLSAPTADKDPVRNIDLTTAVATINANINAAVQNKDAKDSVRVASKVNINLAAPGANIDGVAMNVGESFLAMGQATASQNGAYTYNGPATAATRRIDSDSSAKVTSQTMYPVEEGTYANLGFKLATINPIVLGTTALSFQLAAVYTAPVLSTSNKFMTAAVTANDGDVACATALLGTPAAGSVITVLINGVLEQLGDAVKTKSCYFSADNGATAKAWTAIASGDKLYWVGSVAGYQLAATDQITFEYQA